jgi:hypothetical protein
MDQNLLFLTIDPAYQSPKQKPPSSCFEKGDLVVKHSTAPDHFLKYNMPGIVCFILFRQKTLEFLTQMSRYNVYLLMCGGGIFSLSLGRVK